MDLQNKENTKYCIGKGILHFEMLGGTQTPLLQAAPHENSGVSPCERHN